MSRCKEYIYGEISIKCLPTLHIDIYTSKNIYLHIYRLNKLKQIFRKIKTNIQKD